jgi:uncharacterized protein (TIGR02246 family)
MDEDERAIRDLVETWMEASKAGDTERVLGLMSDEILFTVTGRPPFGKSEFASMSRQMAGIRMEGSSHIEELKVLGGWAWLRNRIEIEMSPPGAEPVRRSGYTLTILRKEEDGFWRLYRDANLVS